jgi:co-chaperonin GroES (HSP10)
MSQMPNIRPMNDNVLIELEPEGEMVANNTLHKPDGANEHVLRTARVIKVGPGKWCTHQKHQMSRREMMCVPGMRIVFIKFVATHTNTARDIQQVIGEDYALIKDNDAICDIGSLAAKEISQP